MADSRDSETVGAQQASGSYLCQDGKEALGRKLAYCILGRGHEDAQALHCSFGVSASTKKHRRHLRGS